LRTTEGANRHQVAHIAPSQRSAVTAAVVVAIALLVVGLTVTAIDLGRTSHRASGSAQGVETGLDRLTWSGRPAPPPSNTTPTTTTTTTTIPSTTTTTSLPKAVSKPPLPTPAVPVVTGAPMATPGTTAPSTPTTTTPAVPAAHGVSPTAPVMTTTTVPTTNAAAASTLCKPDPAPTIAALPPGSTFHGIGCYITGGILVTQPDITIDGGVYFNPITPPSEDAKPLIRIKDVTGVTVKNVTLDGANMAGGFHRHLVGEEGVEIVSSSDVTLTNIATNNTFGDGLMFDYQPRHPASTNVTVNGLTITKSGRQGITVGYVTNSTFTNVDIVSSADTGWDYESDIANVGSGNITVNHASGKGVLMSGFLSGPITYNDPAISGYVVLINSAAASGQQVVFNGGTILLRNTFHGRPPAGMWVRGPGNLSFMGVTIGRRPSERPLTDPAWSVTEGGHLTLFKSPVLGSQGTHDASSSVAIVK
jgi:hypothetical protein